MSPERKPSPGMLSAAFHKLKKEPPKILAKTARKKGKAAAEKQRVAIAFSKAERGDV